MRNVSTNLCRWHVSEDITNCSFAIGEKGAAANMRLHEEPRPRRSHPLVLIDCGLLLKKGGDRDGGESVVG